MSPLSTPIADIGADIVFRRFEPEALISKVIRSSRLRAGASLTVSEPDSLQRITRRYTARGYKGALITVTPVTS
jgi:hypothetical protein